MQLHETPREGWRKGVKREGERRKQKKKKKSERGKMMRQEVRRWKEMERK